MEEFRYLILYFRLRKYRLVREDKTFAERSKKLKSDEAKRKFFLVYEGEKTESIYFSAMNDFRGYSKVSHLIELVPLIRSYSEDGWTNPKKILDRVISNLEEEKTGNITYESLLNRIMAYLHDQGIIKNSKVQAYAIWQILKDGCVKILERTLYEDVVSLESDCRALVDYLNDQSDIVNVVDDITNIIKTSDITYDENLDKICLIVDRDKNSFYACPGNNQYEYVLRTCENKGFGFYISNPCFEFWLLLHFDEIFELDPNKLLENPKVTAERRYTEHELRKLLPGYDKNKYNAQVLVKRIDMAIKNEHKFCEDAEKLADSLGSNIALLLQEMQENSSM